MLRIFGLVKSYGGMVLLVAIAGCILYQSFQVKRLQTKLNTATTKLADKQAQWKDQQADAKTLVADIRAQYQKDLDQAVANYQLSLDSIKPDTIVTERIVKDYATTSAGRAVGLDPDGVQRFYEARARVLDRHPASAPVAP